MPSINRSTTRLYVGHDRIGTYGVLVLDQGEMMAIEGTERFDEIIADVVDRIKENGFGKRIEHIAGGVVEVDFVPIDSTDPFYPEAVVQALRSEGWRAVQLDADRAEAWRLLATLPMEKAERMLLMDALPGLDADALKELVIVLRNP